MPKKKITAEAIEAGEYNKGVASSYSDDKPKPIKDLKGYFRELAKEKIGYSSEYSPAGASPYAQSSTRRDFGLEGFNERLGAGLLPEDHLGDRYAQNQGGLEQMGLGIPRVLGGTIMKGLEGAALLASGLGVGAYNLGVTELKNRNIISQDTNLLGLEDVTNNPMVNTLMTMEEGMKDYLKVYKPQDWEDQNILQQIGSTAWWADEGADGLAFALSNIIPAGAIGKLGLGMKVARGLGAGVEATEAGLAVTSAATRAAGKMGKLGEYANSLLLSRTGLASPLKLAKNIDNAAQVAYMTGSESLFEAKDTGDQIKGNILNQYNQTVQDGEQVESYDELPMEIREANKERIGGAMQETFMANLAALSFSNYIEVGLINKVFGKSAKAGLSGKVDMGKGLDATVSKIARTGVDRFLNKRIPSVIGSALKQSAIEGLYEENIQHAIQNVSTSFGHQGVLDYIGDVGEEFIGNFEDKQAWKGMFTGMLLGGGMGALAANKQYTATEEAVTSGINKINEARENFVNMKSNLYMRNEDGTVKEDEEGNPVYNVEEIAKFRANQNQVGDLAVLHDLYKEAGNEEIAEALRDEATAKYALAHLEAGLGDELTAKVKALSSYKEEDLAEQGINPIEIKDGQKVSPQDRARNVAAFVEQVKKDYEVVSKVIPAEENARLNEAVKTISRVRSLQKTEKKLNEEVFKIKSNLEGQTSVVEQINSITREIQNLKINLPIAEENGDVDTRNRYLKEIELKENALKEIKEGSVEELTKSGYVIPAEIQEITTKEQQLPEYKELIEKERKLVETTLAKDNQLARFNSISDFNTGRQAFGKEQVKSFLDNIAKRGQEAEQEDILASFQEGQLIEYTDKKGVTKKAYVTTNENGKLKVGNTFLDANFLKNFTVRQFTEEETSELVEKAKLDIRKSQLQEKINFREKLLIEREAALERLIGKLIDAESSLEELEYAKTTGKIRVSAYTLDKRIKAAEDLVNQLNKDIEEGGLYDEKLRNDIVILQDRIDNEIDIDIAYVQNQLDDLERDFVENEVTLQGFNNLLNTLKGYLKDIKDTWVLTFPNRKRQVKEEYDLAKPIKGSPELIELEAKVKRGVRRKWDDPSDWATLEEEFTVNEIKKALREGEEYDKALVEIDVKKDEIERTIQTIKALEKESESIFRRMEAFRKEIKEYEAKVNRIIHNKTVTPEKETDTGDYTQDAYDMFNAGLRPDFSRGLNKTAGTEKSPVESQKRWFKFTESYNPNKNHKLRTVKIDDAVYGVGRENDLFKDDSKEFHTTNNIKILVVDKNGEPVYQNGGLVYTSLIEIRDEQKVFEDFVYTNQEPMFTNINGLNEKKVSAIIEDYRTQINLIKKSDKPMFLSIDGKSNGLVNEGEKITAKSAFGSNLQVKVITDKVTVFGETQVSTPKGTVYVNYNGRAVPAKVRNITPLEAPEILKHLKAYAAIRGKVKNPPVMQMLKSVLFLSKVNKNPELSMFFVKNEDNLALGDSIISSQELIDGKYDQEIVEHLLTMNHQVDRKLSESKEPYTDLFGKQWNNYNEYLLEERDSVAEVPLTFTIAPYSSEVEARQFSSVYLNYGFPKPVVEEKEKQVKATQAEAIPKLEYRVQSEIVAENNKTATKPVVLFDFEAELAEEENVFETEALQELEQKRDEEIKNAKKPIIFLNLIEDQTALTQTVDETITSNGKVTTRKTKASVIQERIENEQKELDDLINCLYA